MRSAIRPLAAIKAQMLQVRVHALVEGDGYLLAQNKSRGVWMWMWVFARPCVCVFWSRLGKSVSVSFSLSRNYPFLGSARIGTRGKEPGVSVIGDLRDLTRLRCDG